jgi:hypothetical protein
MMVLYNLHFDLEINVTGAAEHQRGIGGRDTGDPTTTTTLLNNDNDRSRRLRDNHHHREDAMTTRQLPPIVTTHIAFTSVDTSLPPPGRG